MKIAIDVHYRDDFAKAVSIEFEGWEDEVPLKVHEAIINEVEEYISGQFYKRELPCILEVLKCSPIEKIELIVVDGYVTLNDDGKKGLGKYLYETLGEKIPIIGVAKRSFKGNELNTCKLYRGESKNPLYISSVGVSLEAATKSIERMTGKYRMPDLLKLLDRKTKE